MQLIDTSLTRALFEELPSEVVAPLCDATRSDLRDLSENALAAAARGDDGALSRARHALKGLCGNYGAAMLLELTVGPLGTETERARLRSCVEATIDALFALAAPFRDQ